MPLTFEDIQKEITASPDLAKKVNEHVVSSLKNEGLHIRTKEEETEFLTNYEKNIIGPKVTAGVEQGIGEKIKAVHDQYDADLLELTGDKKKPNEKTYEFLKRKLTELKAAKKDGNDDPVLADRIKTLEAEIASEKTKSTEAVKEIERKYFSKMVDGGVGNALEKFTIAAPAHITAEDQKQAYANSQRAMIKNDFLLRFEAKSDNDGNVAFYDKSGNIQLNKATGKPMTETELIAANYSNYFQAEKKPVGGTGNNGKTGGNNYPDFKTKAEVANYLEKEQKLSAGSQEFNKQYKEIITALALTT